MGCDFYSMTDRQTDTLQSYHEVFAMLCRRHKSAIALEKKELARISWFRVNITLFDVTTYITFCTFFLFHFCRSCYHFLYQFFPAVGAYSCKNYENAKINEAEPPFLLHQHSPGNTFTYFQTKDLIENNILPKQTYKPIICFKIHNTTYLHVLVCQTKEQRDKVIAIKSLSYQIQCLGTRMPLLNTCSSTETK